MEAEQMRSISLIYVRFSHCLLSKWNGFRGCMHARREEVNLLFEHGLAPFGVVYGQSSRGKFKGIWSGWPVMLLSIGESVCHSDMKKQPESHDTHWIQYDHIQIPVPSNHSRYPSKLCSSALQGTNILPRRSLNAYDTKLPSNNPSFLVKRLIFKWVSQTLDSSCPFCHSAHQTEKGKLPDPRERWLNSLVFFPLQIDGGRAWFAWRPGRGRRKPAKEEEAVQSRLWATQQHTGQGPLVLLPSVPNIARNKRSRSLFLCIWYIPLLHPISN